VYRGEVILFYIIKDSKVISICDFKPSIEDLATRDEISIECDETVGIGWTYNGSKFSPPIPIVPTKESLLASIRMQRDSLLSASDAMMLSDYPLPSGNTREQWTQRVLIYRQALRDMTKTCDVNDPVYPTL
jgi:hypothetical protein